MANTMKIDVPFLPEPTEMEIPSAEELHRASAAPREPEDERIPLDRARALGDRIVESLRPFCWKIEIAGSIRRGRPFVGDIDLVVIPTNHDAFRKRVLEHTTPVTNGATNMIVKLRNGVQLDIFTARPDTADMFDTIPSNWGSLLVCRTGSKEHNIFLAKAALHKGLQWDPYNGVKRQGKIIASATEEDIFRAVGLPYIKPEDREK